jgi:hypothetical protein
MRKYNSLYYFLIVLLIMGAFASMAQNSYGLKILGGVSIAFGFLFLLQLLYRLRKNERKKMGLVIEQAALTLLSFLIPFRLFHIRVRYAEWILVVTGAALFFVYLLRLIHRFQLFQSKNKALAVLLMAFYGSILFFIISMISFSLMPWLARFTGIVAFVLLILFLAAGLIKRQFVVDGENVSAFAVLAHNKDQSLLLISLFFIFSLYVGFTATGILPELYSDEFPQAYFELVNKAESGKEMPVNGKYKHEEFKKMYDQFLKRSIIKDAIPGTKP